MHCRLCPSHRRLGCSTGNKCASTWGFLVVIDGREVTRPILYKLLREIGLDPPAMDKCFTFPKRHIPLMSQIMYGPAKMAYPLVSMAWWWNELAMLNSKWYRVLSIMLNRYWNSRVVVLPVQWLWLVMAPLSKAWTNRRAGDLRTEAVVMLGR